MRTFLVAVFTLFVSSAHAAEVSPCELAHGSTWKVGLRTNTPGAVHVVSHCQSVDTEALAKMRKEEVAAVISWTHKIKNLDVTRSLYRYYFIVRNDYNGTLRIGLSEWKVAHAPLVGVIGNEVEVPPCVVVAIHFLSPGAPRMETTHLQLSLPDAEGKWSAADQPRQLPIHVPTSSYFFRGEVRAQKLPPEEIMSAACK